MEGEKEPYHTLMSQLGKHTKNVKAATILAAAKKRRECVCVFVYLLIKRPVFTQSMSQSFTTFLLPACWLGLDSTVFVNNTYILPF